MRIWGWALLLAILIISSRGAPGPIGWARDASDEKAVGWRRDGSGFFPDATPQPEWSEKKNIKWQAVVGIGASSPVVHGEFCLVTSEPGILLCLGRAKGDVRWKADLKADLPQDVQGKLKAPAGTKDYARATPVTDGKRIYVALTNGLVGCYSIDGKRQWAQAVDPAPLSYGPSASPVLVGDKLLVDSKDLKALEAGTGRLLWAAKEAEPHYGTPAVATLEGTAVAVTPKGAVVRVSDGEVLLKGLASGLGGDQAPSPLVDHGIVYFTYRLASAVKLSFQGGKLRSEKLWERPLPGDVIASPILDQGLLYVIPAASPDYRVLDAKTGEVLLEKPLGLSTNFYPSLSRAGKYLFLGNDKGDMIVLEPGPAYKEVARNDLPDGSSASPAFQGEHVFLRGGEILYCIGP